MEPEGTSELPAASKALFLEKVRQSNAACQGGDYAKAVALYSDALQLDPTNHILYSNRSAALVKMGQFTQALQDATRARELNTKWPKVRNLQARVVPKTVNCKDTYCNRIGAVIIAVAAD